MTNFTVVYLIPMVLGVIFSFYLAVEHLKGKFPDPKYRIIGTLFGLSLLPFANWIVVCAIIAHYLFSFLSELLERL